MNKAEEFLNKQGLQKWETFTRKFVKELLQLYADEQSRELQEPIENALYATGRFWADECTELAEGIIQYVNESNQHGEYPDTDVRGDATENFN